MKEVVVEEEDLALFMEMGSNCEKEKIDELLRKSDEIDDSLGSKPDNSSVLKNGSVDIHKPRADDDFLNSENEKSDYDWLLTPPRTTLLPSTEIESKKTVMNPIGISKTQPTALRSRPTNIPCETAKKISNMTSRPQILTDIVGNRRPSSSKSSSRPSTPTSRATFPRAVKSTAPQGRSSTPTRPATARSSTPTARNSIPSISKPAPRSLTPTPHSSSSMTKKAPKLSKNPIKPTQNHGFSLKSRGHSMSNGIDDVNPVLMGTKMVERVVNMRKLAPPKQDDQNSIEKKSSNENSGFGRSLSKKSLDMAIRHMDITRRIPGNLRSQVVKKLAPAESE